MRESLFTQEETEQGFQQYARKSNGALDSVRGDILGDGDLMPSISQDELQANQLKMSNSFDQFLQNL